MGRTKTSNGASHRSARINRVIFFSRYYTRSPSAAIRMALYLGFKEMTAMLTAESKFPAWAP
jgi:hypothetical protein